MSDEPTMAPTPPRAPGHRAASALVGAAHATDVAVGHLGFPSSSWWSSRRNPVSVFELQGSISNCRISGPSGTREIDCKNPQQSYSRDVMAGNPTILTTFVIRLGSPAWSVFGQPFAALIV
jgi:hypothetical protein